MSQQWKEYQEKNNERFLNEMLDLLRIPSISAKIENKDDMLKCAEAAKKSLLAAGCDKAEGTAALLNLQSKTVKFLPVVPPMIKDSFICM